VTGSFSANPVAQGPWSIAPDVVGPFGATGPSTELVSTAMTVITQGFDRTVTAPTGDLWLAANNPDQLTGLSPVVIGPGRTATIPVTITPRAPTGAHVSGTLYLDEENESLFQIFYNPTGEDVAALPYSYTVG
jgi:hypothetical protein